MVIKAILCTIYVLKIVDLVEKTCYNMLRNGPSGLGPSPISKILSKMGQVNRKIILKEN